MKKLKILQINAWGGRIKDGLTNFIAKNNFDIVCMQEAVWSNHDDFLTLFVDTIDKIKEAAGFDYDFKSSNYGLTLLGDEVRCEHGNVILSKIPFKETQEIPVYGKYDYARSIDNYKSAIPGHRYTAQKVTLENGLTILNYHGYWLKDPLGDSTSTACMKTVANTIRDDSSPIVMCGDLNVVSEAPCMQELDFLTDLTKLHGINTTLRNIRFKKDVACDHILVSNNVTYEQFKVIDEPISDHQALSVTIIL